MVAIGGFHGSSGLSDVEVVDVQKENTNCNPTDLPYAVYRHATVASDQGLITCGGFSDGSWESKCILQRKNGETTSFPTMKSRRSVFGMVLVSDVIYAIGGYPSITTMETINVNHGTEWTEQSLDFSVSSHCVTSVANGKIVVTGGYDGSNVSK